MSRYKKEKLIVLHETGAPRHFEGLSYYIKHLQQQKIYDEPIYVEFNILRQLAKATIRDRRLFIRLLRNVWWLFKLLFSESSTIVLGMAPYDLAVIFTRYLKSRHHIIYYSSWPYWDRSQQPKRIYSRYQIVLWRKFLTGLQAVGVTRNVRDGLLNFTPKVSVIPHCIDASIFKPSRKERGHQIRILYVGRLVKEKGVDVILEMAKTLSSEGLSLDWWFVGTGPLEARIQSEASRSPCIAYKGHFQSQSDLAGIYQQCDILLLPSKKTPKWEELFGIVLIEAMACGVIPIATDCVGPKTIIDDGLNGFIVSDDIRGAIESKIRYLYFNNETLEQMSIESVKKACQNYEVRRVALKWGQVLVETSSI